MVDVVFFLSFFLFRNHEVCCRELRFLYSGRSGAMHLLRCGDEADSYVPFLYTFAMWLIVLLRLQCILPRAPGELR